jgi:hypothetical protein
VVGDTVTYNGGPGSYVWLCVQANTGQTPGTLDGGGNPYWTVLATQVQPEAPPWADLGLQTPSRLIHISPVEPGVSYDLRLRYEMTDGSVTLWTTLAGHMVAGQVNGPPDPTNFGAANLGGGVIELFWDPPTQLNVREFEVRSGSNWASATFDRRTRATRAQFWRATGRTYQFFVAAIDTSGNYDANPPTVTITI